jgi:hypothetical protein
VEWVPSWFPGAGWKRKAQQWYKEFEEMNNVPFEMAKEEAVSWSFLLCFRDASKTFYYYRRRARVEITSLALISVVYPVPAMKPI